jgi:LysR family cyn operon transcriptional activator
MNVQKIDLRLLRSFFVVSRTGNFVRASHSLSITQSALSQQMKELNRYFPEALFEKKGRQSYLTEFGKSLITRIEPLIDQIDETLLQTMHNSKTLGGRLRIGATHTYLKKIGLPASLMLLQSNPNLKIDLELDMAIFPEIIGTLDLEQKVLLEEQFAIIAPHARIRALPKKIDIRFFNDKPMAMLNGQFLMRQQIDMQARQDQTKLDVRIELSNLGDLLTVAKETQLYVIGSPIICEGERTLSHKRIDGNLLCRKAALCWRRDKFMTTAMKAFDEAAHRVAAKIEAN